MLDSSILFDLGTMWPLYFLFAFWAVLLKMLLAALAYDGYLAMRAQRISLTVKTRELLSQFDQRPGPALFSGTREL